MKWTVLFCILFLKILRYRDCKCNLIMFLIKTVKRRLLFSFMIQGVSLKISIEGRFKGRLWQTLLKLIAFCNMTWSLKGLNESWLSFAFKYWSKIKDFLEPVYQLIRIGSTVNYSKNQKTVEFDFLVFKS